MEMSEAAALSLADQVAAEVDDGNVWWLMDAARIELTHTNGEDSHEHHLIVITVVHQGSDQQTRLVLESTPHGWETFGDYVSRPDSGPFFDIDIPK